MREIIIITLYTAIALIALTFLAKLLHWLKESKTVFNTLALFIYNYSYLILIAIGGGFMVFQEIYNSDGDYLNLKTANVIYGLCKAIFSIGAFSGAIKFASTLKLFKEQYKRIIMSPEFNNLLGDKLDAFAHSTNYLEKLDINQLRELWRDVTLTKYKNSFPLIYDDLKSNLENDLFLRANTLFYYKHFHLEYDIVLDTIDDNFINVKQTTNYTIVRNDESEFEWSFARRVHKNDYLTSNTETIINIDGLDIYDSKEAIYKENDDADNTAANEINIQCVEMLSGKKQYNVKKVTTYRQNLNLDRSLGFGSSRIIDDLLVTIKYSENISVYFSKVNKNLFEEDIDTENRCLKYENRNLLLPGEKFRIFLIRPNK